MSKIGIIIQARMGSTRLPSKIMLPINGVPIFQYQLNRLNKLPHSIIIATTTQPQDDVIVDFSRNNHIECFRGSEVNVLERYYKCAEKYDLQTIVRITSDCPFIDADIINVGIQQFVNEHNENVYLSNTLERTYPRGADFEVFSFTQLKKAYDNANDLTECEHVTPYIWKNKSGNIVNIQFKQQVNYSKYRLTLDTIEDFKLIKELIETYKADKLSMEQICNVMIQHPELTQINEHIEQKKI